MEEEEEEEKGRYGKEDLKLLGARGSHQPRQTSESAIGPQQDLELLSARGGHQPRQTSESARVLSKTLNCWAREAATSPGRPRAGSLLRPLL